MRQFASSGFRIWNLGREAKWIYTGFGLFSVAAIFVSILFYEDLVGPKTAGIAGYYAGALDSRREVTPAGGGPKLEIAEEGTPITVAATYRKLLEVTHFHLFTVPVFLLIIAHLFMLTGLSSRWKIIWIATGWLSSFVHLLAPWLIRYGGRVFLWMFPASGALMALSLTIMTVYPIFVMWTYTNDRVSDGDARA